MLFLERTQSIKIFVSQGMLTKAYPLQSWLSVDRQAMTHCVDLRGQNVTMQ